MYFAYLFYMEEVHEQMRRLDSTICLDLVRSLVSLHDISESSPNSIRGSAI